MPQSEHSAAYPVTSQSSGPARPRPRSSTESQPRFTFYDIESLTNVFSLCAYTPATQQGMGQGMGRVMIFHLIDDEDLNRQLDIGEVARVFSLRNPALPPITPEVYDLRGHTANIELAKLMGLSNATVVSNLATHEKNSDFPHLWRPVCDTDPGYDPAVHPFLCGYNSLHYDTVMLSLYFMEAFAALATFTRAKRAYKRNRDLFDGDPAEYRRLLKLAEGDVAPPQRPVLDPFVPVAASTMRAHNDQLFGEEYKAYMPNYLTDPATTQGVGWESTQARIRRAMLASGRHIDAARLNEAQSRVNLKRLLGMLGHQILESDNLEAGSRVTTIADLYELLAYNLADCVGLSQLFEHPTYSSAFELRRALMTQYPETVYAQIPGAQSPDISPAAVRQDRLRPDSSSAQYVARILCPYGRLGDLERVSFDYPSPAGQTQGESGNVLEECKRFFEDHVTDQHARARFGRVYDYYRRIEGKNFNDSIEYREQHPSGPPALSLAEIEKAPNNLPYYLADGTPTSCFATFSVGGIHGAEADLDGFAADQAAHQAAVAMLDRARREVGDATRFAALAKDQHNTLRLPDGSTVDKRLVLYGSDPERVAYRPITKATDPAKADQIQRARAQVPSARDLLATQRRADQELNVVLVDGTVLDGRSILANTSLSSATYRETPTTRAPALFVDQPNKSTKLHPRYARTSAGAVIHEDFTSYYPNLLRKMGAFYNPALGEDRYAKIFFQKQEYGARLKSPDLSEAERARLITLREGTKLILNAASGAGDAAHKTPIRMNNRIISMRIIGQLFSWRIGQAQTLAGARIISTNTDGLYSLLDPEHGFTAEVNNQVLAEQAAAVEIEIDPEPMILVSKDSNNRLEITDPTHDPTHGPTHGPADGAAGEGDLVVTAPILGASGGTLACHDGPRPDKSLAHPAVLDHTLARYLRVLVARLPGDAEVFSRPFDHDLGRRLISSVLTERSRLDAALLFQNVIAASRGSITYPFAADPPDPATPADQGASNGAITGARALQHVNRIFIVRPGTPGAVSLRNAGAWKVSPAVKERRQRDGAPFVQRDRVALEILEHNGWGPDNYRASERGLTPLPADQDVVVRRINGIDPSWPIWICNGDLHSFSQFQLGHLLGVLDLDIYTQMLAETYEKNWQNTSAAMNARLDALSDGLGGDARPDDESIASGSVGAGPGSDPAHLETHGQDGLGDIA
ncbi:hypothetical protein OG984_02885 [Nocardioides sp. NBC_00368]|uniref:hypothetical protein n=1 Tax=Nocardioides sp. NBC_00368 TaxID=2976000 RepID=UPI002E24B032